MTTIAALNYRGQTAYGGNTGYTLAHDSVMSTGMSSWFTFQDWALGFTGSMLALNVCRSQLTKLETKLISEGDVVTKIGKIHTEYDIGNKPDGEPTWSFGIWCILVHQSGHIWDIDESLCLGPVPSGTFWARGSGERYALGAAHVLMQREDELNCGEIVRRSIQAAIANDLFTPGDASITRIG